jgi:hypothetical protein
VNISFGSCQAILTEDLAMRRVAAKFVPRLLSDSGIFNREKNSRGTPSPYSPDLAPCDFFIFPRIKMKLKGRRFDDADTIKMNTTRELNMSHVAMFPEVAGTLGQVHIISRGLLWRGQLVFNL